MFDKLSIELTKNLDKNTKKNSWDFLYTIIYHEKKCVKKYF